MPRLNARRTAEKARIATMTDAELEQLEDGLFRRAMRHLGYSTKDSRRLADLAIRRRERVVREQQRRRREGLVR